MQNKSKTLSIVGQVQFSGIWRTMNREQLSLYIKRSIQRTLPIFLDCNWGVYDVLLSQSDNKKDIICELQVLTDGEKTFMSTGVASRPNHAFNEALKNMTAYLTFSELGKAA